MKMFDRELKKLRSLLATDRPEPGQQAERIAGMLRDVVLPAKAGLFLVVLYYLFDSGWLYDQDVQSLELNTLKKYFQIYLLCNVLGAVLLGFWRRLPPGMTQWLAFIMGLLDGLFVAGLTIVTGGYASIAFWIFPGLIVLNALTIRLAMPQIVLNLLLSGFYLGAVLLTPQLGWEATLPNTQALAIMMAQQAHAAHAAHAAPAGRPEPHGTNQLVHTRAENLARLNKGLRNDANADTPEELPTPDQLLLPLSVLWLLTFCCYGAQVLLERQRQALLEAAEFARREGQLHSAGRLAAEFAHQIKNPLAIINNAAYSLQRSMRDSNKSGAQQLEIIQEEVARADKVITQIMGYAQLSEGRVEKLKVVEEIERAVEQVFPRAVSTGIKLKTKFTGPFPSLLMQRGHLGEVLVNLLQNARESLAGQGIVSVTAVCDRNQAVEIAVADDGPGIAPDKIERVFEAYFTTKEKGTGLGLAIVKHNAELYGGHVRVESVLGKGAKFTVFLPAKLQPETFAK
jgi:signal transduction histidine kinase